MFGKFKELMELQKKAGDFKKQLGGVIVEAERLNGQIKIRMNGEFEIIDLEISAGLLKEENKNILVSNLKDCFNKAQERARAEIAGKMKASLGGLNLPGL